ncbi:hypothetical protein BDV12DRAFT_25504 [Aspergillus spectabilis]
MPKGMHNPLPASLTSECKKAAQILDSFINGSWRGSPGRELPERVLRNAKGLAILTVTKAGILGSLRIGSGILIARLPDDPSSSSSENNTTPPSGSRWSPPSAISLAGLGFGGQAGFEITDFVFILNDQDSLKTFSHLGSLTLSGNFSIAFGPLGRNAEIAGGVSTTGGGKMVSFAKTKGLFGGVSVESGLVVERRWANRRFLGILLGLRLCRRMGEMGRLLCRERCRRIGKEALLSPGQEQEQSQEQSQNQGWNQRYRLSRQQDLKRRLLINKPSLLQGDNDSD